ncbi:MAG: hypothetical protein EOP49_28235 [Sphingobacteriales bacterium]|nr:MAG: hypothetical protein EOP49_28235 [Sphingobacteriales bacterium]
MLVVVIPRRVAMSRKLVLWTPCLISNSVATCLMLSRISPRTAGGVDTASFCAIAPEHHFALELAQHNPVIKDFLDAFKRASAAGDYALEKHGINTGLTVTHPLLKDQHLPLFIANFVLSGYGSGAIFGCPAHDERDFDFARKYKLPVKEVVKNSSSNSKTYELPYLDYDPNKKKEKSIFSLSGARRSACTDILGLPAYFKNTELHLYISMIADDRKSISDSTYLGTTLIS